MAEHTVWITLDDSNFESEVRGHTGLVMVVFWSDSSGSCHIMAPVIDHVAASFAGCIRVGRLDVDRYPQWSSHYGIYAVPTLIFFLRSQVIDQINGVISTRALTAKVQALLDAVVT